jgi:hypothetical protein
MWGTRELCARLIFDRKVKPKSSITSHIRFLALKQGIFFLDRLKIFDVKSNKLFSVIDSCPIYVRDVQ